MFLLMLSVLQFILFSIDWDPTIDVHPTNEIAWSSTDQELAIATVHGLWVYDFENEVATLISDCNISTYNPVFNMENNLLAYSTADGIIHVVDFITKEELTQFDSQYGVYHMLFIADSSQILRSLLLLIQL